MCSDCSSRLTVLFLLAFLDRTNIGNAKIQGMTAELKMGGHDYNIALFVFFIPVGYIASIQYCCKDGMLTY
jgi:hypothetical protein